VVPVDVAALGVDLLVFAGHKAMLGPLGIGGLWAAEHVRFTCPTATCEIGGDPAVGVRAPFPGFCDLGSVNFPALAGLTAALRWHRQCDDEQRERPRRLARRLLDACRERDGCHVLGGDGPRTATVSLLLDRVPLDQAQQHFREHGVVVRAGTHCAPMALAALGRPDGCIRVSFGPHNVDEHVDAVLAAIDA
jgi:selenocysteine lyase/cysteine desulfurase